MKKDKELVSLIKHTSEYKKLLMAKLKIAEMNNDSELYLLITRLLDEQTQAINDCLDIVKKNNNGQWRSVVCKKSAV